MGFKTNTGGGLAHAVIRFLFILPSIVAFGMAAYCISQIQRGQPALIIVGSVIAIASDVLSIRAYNARSSNYPLTLIGDAFAAIAFGVGFSLLAHIVISSVDDSDYITDDQYHKDLVAAKTALASFVLAMIRLASFLGTAILSLVMVRRWNRQDRAGGNIA